MDLEKVTAPNIRQILELIQQSSACHLKYAIIMKNALDAQNESELLSEFFKCLYYAFLSSYKQKNTYLERIISFSALFATSFKIVNNDDSIVEVHPVLKRIFKFLLELSNSSQDAHRYWSCKLFNKIFQDLEELSDDLYEEIKESMMERLKDPKAVIRCQAVITLHRLQDPTDDQDPIINKLCTLLDSDYNAKVRQLCLEKLALNKHVMPLLLHRIRDVDADVRLIGFQKLTTVAKYLKVSQKRLILQCGFNDSSEKIRNFVSTSLLQNWLEHYDNNFIKLMKSIRLDACYDDIVATTNLVELMLKALFKTSTINDIVKCISVNDHKVIDYENLNWDTILYYRITVQYLRQCESFEDTLNNVLPELVNFCQYIKGYCEFMKNKEDYDKLEYDFTLQQFFLITQGYDVSDSVTGQCLNSLIHHILQREEQLTADVAETVLKNLERTMPIIQQRSVFVCEIISDVIYGDDTVTYEEIKRKQMEKNHTVSQLQSDIILLQEQENHFVFEKNYSEAERVKQELEEKELLLKTIRESAYKPEQNEKKTDVATMLRCLSIAEGLLRSPTITSFNPAIATLNSEIINGALIHEDDAVKEQALKCYALCCVIDCRSARYGIHLFSGLMFSTDLNITQILITSIKAAVDILTIYGLSLVEQEEDEDRLSNSRSEDVKKVFVGGTSLTDLLQGLADLLDHKEQEVQDIATKGVCILLLRSRITSPSLLSRIIIKWANPATDNERIKQFIGLTLNSLTTLSNCSTYFGEAVITTIKTLAYAPKGSAVADINMDNLIKFMTILCQMPRLGTQIHQEIALKILTQMKGKPRSKVNLCFAKTLTFLNIQPENGITGEFLAICDVLKDVINDSQTLKHINKFITNLTKGNVEKLVPIEEDAIE